MHFLYCSAFLLNCNALHFYYIMLHCNKLLVKSELLRCIIFLSNCSAKQNSFMLFCYSVLHSYFNQLYWTAVYYNVLYSNALLVYSAELNLTELHQEGSATKGATPSGLDYRLRRPFVCHTPETILPDGLETFSPMVYH